MCKKNLNIKGCFKYFFMYILFFFNVIINIGIFVIFVIVWIFLYEIDFKFFLVDYIYVIFYLKDLGIYLMLFFLIKEKKFLKFKFG